MVCKDSHRLRKLLISIILCTRCILDKADSICKEICLVYILCSIKESKDSLKSPTSINVLLLKWSKVSIMMLLILHEYIISKLCILSAIATWSTIRTTVIYISYIEHLAIWTTRTIFKSPPVIFCRKIMYILRLKS